MKYDKDFGAPPDSKHIVRKVAFEKSFPSNLNIVLLIFIEDICQFAVVTSFHVMDMNEGAKAPCKCYYKLKNTLTGGVYNQKAIKYDCKQRTQGKWSDIILLSFK